MGKKQQPAQALRSRIVGDGDEAPDQLLANPLNWRRHPKQQQEALEAMLRTVGWVQRVIVNRRTGHLVDGHLRVEVALRRNEPRVPVLYVDLSEDEEKVVLAAIDPIGGLAETDHELLDQLLDGLASGDAQLDAFLATLGTPFPDDQLPANDALVADVDKHLLLIETASERECETLFAELTERGLTVKIMQ